MLNVFFFFFLIFKMKHICFFKEFKEILIPKLFPSAEDIQYFKCLSIIDKNISFNQLHLNGLWTSGERDISNLLL